MKKLKAWLNAFRLRTLPLSLSGIIWGTALANHEGFRDYNVFHLSILTTLFLQILSNLANDLGDYLKGADNEGRVGPQRATQSGEISPTEMKGAVWLFSILSIVSASALVYEASAYFSTTKAFAFLLLGLFCVLAAILYTMGKKAYGYLGLGDVFVFIFFGLVSVLGVYNLYLPEFSLYPVLGAVGFGLLSTAVLNLNNLRDHINDEKVGKRTLIVKMGFAKGKKYHFALLTTAFLSFLFFWLCFKPWGATSLVPFVILFFHAKKVWRTENPADLDPELKKVALTTFFVALLGALFMIYC